MVVLGGFREDSFVFGFLRGIVFSFLSFSLVFVEESVFFFYTFIS